MGHILELQALAHDDMSPQWSTISLVICYSSLSGSLCLNPLDVQ